MIGKKTNAPSLWSIYKSPTRARSVLMLHALIAWLTLALAPPAQSLERRSVDEAKIKATVSQYRKQSGCSRLNADVRRQEFVLHHETYLVLIDCFEGPYNRNVILALRQNRTLAPIAVDRWDDLERRLVPTHGLTNATYDTHTQTLRAFYKTRGPADCGERGEWRWRNRRFELTNYWVKRRCDGQAFNPEPDWQVVPSR